MKRAITFFFGALAVLIGVTANATWTYDSSTKVLENEDWSISAVTSENSALTISGAISRKDGSESTTIDFTSCKADCGYPVNSVSITISSSVPCKRFIAPDVTSLTGFNGNTVIEEVEVSPNITSFGTSVFKGTSALKTLRPKVFPKLTSLGQSSFQETAIEGDLEFPAVTEVLKQGFLLAKNITSLKFASLTQTTANYPFSSMASLTNFYAPKAVKLDTSVFTHGTYGTCKKLESLTISPDVTGFPNLEGCTSLKSITPTEFPKVESLGRLFKNTSSLACDLSFPLVSSLADSTFMNSAVTSVNLPMLPSVPKQCFYPSPGLTNLTILGSSAAINARTISDVADNFIINWLSEDVPSGFSGFGETSTFMPKNSLSPIILRVPVTEENRAAWEAHCTTKAENFTDAHRAISNYPLVAAKAIGFVGYPSMNSAGEVISISPVKSKGIFWIVDSTEIPSVNVTIECPEWVKIAQVTSDGFEVLANADGTYTIELEKTMNITYLPTENRLFADGTDSVTVENLAPVETVLSSVCPKASVLAYARIGERLYRTLQEAVNVGGEIALNYDISLAGPVTVAANKKVSIDLNGKTLSASDVVFAVAGQLIVKGTGTVDAATPFSGAGTVQLMGGTYLLDVAALCVPGYVATAQGTDPETWVVAPDTDVSTLTLDTATFEAEHISCVEVVTTAPVTCTTNGTVISWQIAKRLPFTLIYTSLGSYRFADRGTTEEVSYPTGIVGDTVADVADVPERFYHPTWSWDKTAKTCTDGNWTFNCTEATVGGVDGIALTDYVSGCGDLDLLTFKDDVGENIDVIKLTGSLFRYYPDVVTNVCAPAVRYVDHRVFGNESSYYRPIKSVEFSPEIEYINVFNIGCCRNITNFLPRVMPKLETFKDTFANCTGLKGDFSMPIVTNLVNGAFSNTDISSFEAPLLEIIPRDCFNSCNLLTNVTVLGSTNVIQRQIISGVPDNFVLNWLSEDVPQGFEEFGFTKCITSENPLSPCIWRVNLTEKNRAAWEDICTRTRRNFRPVHRAISNYPLVGRRAVGFVGYPSKDESGVVTSISPVAIKGIFWIVNSNPGPGIVLTVR